MTSTRPPNHSVAIRLMAGAAVLLVGALVRLWFESPGTSIGLWGIEVCERGCRTFVWDDVRNADFDLILAGYTAGVASLVGALLLAVTAFKQLNGARGPVRHARIVVTVALVAMVWFVIRMVDANADFGVLGVLVPGLTIGTWFTLRSA